MSEDVIQLNADGSGKKVRTLKRTVGANEVHEEVHNVTDGDGTVIDPRKDLEVTGSALPTGAATEATLGTVHGHVDSIDGKITACNTGAIAGSLTQSTKHDSKVYAPAVFDASASGNLVAAVANKVTKLHALAIQAQGTVVVNLNDGAAGTSLMEWSFQAREGAVLPLAPCPAFWAKTTANTILYVTLSAAVQVTITAIISSDDAS
jgi:hypothetical protein